MPEGTSGRIFDTVLLQVPSLKPGVGDTIGSVLDLISSCNEVGVRDHNSGVLS